MTTRDVKASGVNTVRSIDDTLETQQNVNLFLDQGIASLEKQVAEIADGQGGTSQDLEGITADVAENTQGVSDNADSLSGLTDLVSDNIIDINSIKEDIENLPPPTDISDITSDVNDIALQVGKNTLGINENKKSIDAISAPIDLQPLTDSIETNALGVSTNASAISSIQSVDAKQQGQINDLTKDVVDLQEFDHDTSDFAVVNSDNKFTVPQTIQDGLKISGSKAFVEMDRGTAVTFSNNNAFNPVIEIERSNGDVSLALHADGHIRGVKTDAADGSSAVSVDYLSANGGGGGDNGADLSDYATKLALADEERARILGDQGIAEDLENAIKTQKYDDTDVRNMIGQEEKARQAADTSLDDKIKFETKFREETDTNLQTQINNISGGGDVNLDAYVSKAELAGFEYATEEFVTNAIEDFATERFCD